MSEGKETAIPRSLQAAMIAQFAVGGAILPFVSILLRDRGLDFTQISRIFSASSATLLVFPFLWGMLADRLVPLNRLFTLLNLLVFGALLVLARQDSFWALLWAFTLFYACFHPTLTLINALSFHHLPNPSAQFGLLRAWGSIGWIVPSLPIYFWLAGVESADLNFVLYLGMGLALAMAGVTFALPHTPPGAARQPGHDAVLRLGYWPAMKRLVSDLNYVTVLGAFFLVAASHSLLIYYSPPFLEDLGVKREWIGPIQCIGVVLEIALFQWLPRIIRSWGFAASLLVGCGALVARHLLFAWSDNVWLLSASYLLAGMVIVFFHIGASILVNSIAGIEVRATAQTLMVLLGSGLGPMGANWIAGRLAAAAGDDLRPVFLFAAVLAGMAGLLVLLRGRRLNRGVG